MMSSNLGLTSSTVSREISIGFGNLLDDSCVDKGVRRQELRLPAIAQYFNNMQSLDIAAWCEGKSEKHLRDLAQQCDKEIIGEVFRYSPRECMALAVRPGLKIDREPEVICYGRKRDGFYPGLISAKLAGVETRVVHNPHQPAEARDDRLAATVMLLDRNPDSEISVIGKTAVVFGDFNALEFQAERFCFLVEDFLEVHAEDRPIYPNDAFRGISYPKHAPSISVDAMYASPDITIANAMVFPNNSSDHPFIWMRGILPEPEILLEDVLAEYGKFN